MANIPVTSISAPVAAARNNSLKDAEIRETGYRFSESPMGNLLSANAMKKLAQDLPDNDCGGSHQTQRQQDEEQRIQAIDQTINKAISNLLDLSWLSPFIEKDRGMDLGQALAVLDRYFEEIKGKNNMVSHDDLEKISEGKQLQGVNDAEISYANDLQTAARYMLRQKDDYDALDTAQERKENRGNASDYPADSFFSKGDLASALSDTSLAEADMKVLRTLLCHVDEMGSRITPQDLKNIADGSTRPKELRDAAAYVLQHTDFWTRLDTAMRISKRDVSEQGGDGIASAADIRALAERPEFKSFSKSDSA